MVPVKGVEPPTHALRMREDKKSDLMSDFLPQITVWLSGGILNKKHVAVTKPVTAAHWLLFFSKTKALQARDSNAKKTPRI